ncbi:hypothetical protein PQR34_46805 [Paraburkholderia sediminicola]|uniref:hypothetical protein n=1 Tax=Paraburkholderia sediminicola TaxID=458836 RepID=UPI0038BC562C
MTSASNYHLVYVGKVIDLAATIVIKSVDAAEAMNNYVRVFYGDAAVDQSDPGSWHYYKNLAGEYHFIDTPMYVVSMDTLETIAFTTENLAIHRATARAYQYGTRQYQELLTQYPRQEMLIRGILYPVDKAYAIAGTTADATILGGYPPELVELNEYSFISRLQTWINRFRLRWFNRAYTVTDNLYLSSHLGIMYAMLPCAIISLRKQICKTNEAHSFHVRQYLVSHGALDGYFDQLTTRQALLLYRNMLYLERNPGQRAIFSWLTDTLLTQRAIPLAEYTMRHDVSAMPTQLYPELFFKRHELNLGYSYDTLDRITLDQMLDKEQPTARDNAKYQADAAPDIQERMVNSASNVLQTKALESAMVDYSDASPYTLDLTLMSHWLWLAYRGLYTTVLNVENPRTGERIAIPVRDAYALMMFAFCKSIGITLDGIPPFFAMHVQRMPQPSPADLMSVVDLADVDVRVARWLLRYPPLIPVLISSEAFYNRCQDIWRAKNIQNSIVALQERQRVRGYVDNMMNRCYADAMCDLFPGENYTAWFAARNLDVSAFTLEDFGALYLSLTRAATGLDLLTTNSLASLQKAMIGLLGQLSSYSVQFMSYINTGAIVPVGYPVTRFGDIDVHVSDEVEFPVLTTNLQAFFSRLMHAVTDRLDDCRFSTWLGVRMNDRADFVLKDLVRFDRNDPVVCHIRHELGVGVSYVEHFPADTDDIFPVLGISRYLALTADQRSHFKDVYGDHYTQRPPGIVLTNPMLSGFREYSAPPLPNGLLSGFTEYSAPPLPDDRLSGFTEYQ